MPEIEIHSSADPTDHRVGALVCLIGIVLSIVTILGHREHTAAVVHKIEANSQWSFYQTKKIKKDNDDIAITILKVLSPNSVTAATPIAKLTVDAGRYEEETPHIKAQADARDLESAHSEAKALRFDQGEGFMELGLVMTSLYFLVRRRFFVSLGLAAALIGSLFGACGALPVVGLSLLGSKAHEAELHLRTVLGSTVLFQPEAAAFRACSDPQRKTKDALSI